jgi:hypothetical protein
MTITVESAQEVTKSPRVAPRFPEVIWRNDRGYVLLSSFTRYTAALQAASLGVEPVEPPFPDPDTFLTLNQVAARLGVGRRTVGRLIVESGRGIGRRHAGTPRVKAEPHPAAVSA